MSTPLASLSSVTMQGTNCIGLGRATGTITGLYYSSDSGQNWYISNITTVSGTATANPRPIKMSGAYAIACTNTLTYYSSDYGHTWTASDLPSAQANLSLSFNGANALIGSSVSNVGGVISGNLSYYSTNSGVNWTVSTFSGLAPDVGAVLNVFSVQIDASGNAVAHTSKGIYYSTDNGANFTKSTYPGSDTDAESAVGVMRLNYVVSSVSGIGILYSTDYGQTFTNTYPSNTYPVGSNTFSNSNSIAMDISGNCIISINITGGPTYNILYSSNYGATWTISTPGTYTGVSGANLRCALSISGGIAVSLGNIYSTDNGQTWSTSTPQIASNTRAISNVGLNVITSNLTNAYYSADGGATYTIATLLPSLTPTVLSGFSIPTKTVGDSSFSITPPTTNSDGAFTYTSSDLSVATISGTTITIVGAGTSTITASQAATATYTAETITASFQVNAPPIICFLEGSKILHLNADNKEEYIEIEKLKKGDFIKTVKNDYKKIEDIGYSTIFNNINDIRSTDKLYKCSKDVYPELIEDLVITGAHSILVSNFKDEQQLEKTQDVLGKIYVTGMFYRLPACVDDRTTIYEIKGLHTIWHFSLENENYYSNYGVYANGLLVETCSKRMMKECGMHI